MSEYVAPLADMRFVLENIVDLPGLAKLPGFEHAEPELVYGALEEAGRFFSQEFAPLNRVGDEQHSRRNDDGTVTTPDGFGAAYRRYVDAGWGGVPFPADYGGGGFPWLVGHRPPGDDDRGQHGLLAVPAAHPGRHRHAAALRRTSSSARPTCPGWSPASGPAR